MLLIFLFSSVDGQSIENAGLGDESLHISGHFVLYVLLGFSFYKATKSIFYSILLTLLYGIFDEFHQSLVPLRSASLKDIITDFIGGLVAGGIIWKLLPKLPRRLKNWLQE